MSVSEKLYRFLIRAYSPEYRGRYAAPMEQLFRDRLRETRGLAGWIILWGRTLADWVTSVPPSYWTAHIPEGPFSSFGDPARRCIFFARCEAGSFARNEVTLNHLLLGILRQQRTLVSDLAREKILRAIEADEPSGRRIPPILNPHALSFKSRSRFGPGNIELGEEALGVVTAAIGLAHTAGRNTVEPADLATAILQGPDSLAARLLREYKS
jgi:hypothetical protein